MAYMTLDVSRSVIVPELPSRWSRKSKQPATGAKIGSAPDFEDQRTVVIVTLCRGVLTAVQVPAGDYVRELSRDLREHEIRRHRVRVHQELRNALSV